MKIHNSDCLSKEVKNQNKDQRRNNLSDIPELVVDCLVLPQSHARHLLEHPLTAERLEAVDLQLRVPDVLGQVRLTTLSGIGARITKFNFWLNE